MPNVATVLKAEIERLAKKAVKARTRELENGLKEQRRVVVELRKRLGDQDRQLAKLANAVERAATGASVPIRTVVRPRVTGWRRDTVRAIRKRFSITQGQLAALLGVQLNSVSLWETGRTVPRRRQQEKLMAVRDMSKEEVEKALDSMGMGTPALGTGRRGRPPGTPSFGRKPRKKTTRKKAARKKKAGSKKKSTRRKAASRAS